MQAASGLCVDVQWSQRQWAGMSLACPRSPCVALPRQRVAAPGVRADGVGPAVEMRGPLRGPVYSGSEWQTASLVSSRQRQWQRQKHVSTMLERPSRPRVTAGAAGALALRDDGSDGTSATHHATSTAYDAEIWSVALPALVSMLLEPVMGVINTGMIGRLGTQQLGAVSVATMVVSFATFLFSFLLFLTTPEIAGALARNDRAEVSRITAKSMWVAGAFGLMLTGTLVTCGPQIIALMAPPEPAVAKYAAEYVSVRAWGVFAVLIAFVATGTYRGFKDTRTPLFAAVGSATVSLILNYLFIYVLHWGVAGSALAVTLAQAVSCTVLCGLLVHKGMLRLADLTVVPSLASVLPMLRKGLVLGLRNVISFGMVLYASALCVRAGSSFQAGFEIIRQVWMLTIQFFECLNVATQTLCAAYLGAGDSKSAREVLQRLLTLGTGIGAIMGVVVFALQLPITGFFSKDAAVIAQVLAALPMVCAMFPMDAAASIMDGSLLAAKQTDYMSVVQIAGSVVQYFALIYLASNGLVSTLSIWATLKVMTMVRIGGGLWRNVLSPDSAYQARPTAPAGISQSGTAATRQDGAGAAGASAEGSSSNGRGLLHASGPTGPELQPLASSGAAQGAGDVGSRTPSRVGSALGSVEEEDQQSSQAAVQDMLLAPELCQGNVCAEQDTIDHAPTYETLRSMHAAQRSHGGTSVDGNGADPQAQHAGSGPDTVPAPASAVANRS